MVVTSIATPGYWTTGLLIFDAACPPHNRSFTVYGCVHGLRAWPNQAVTSKNPSHDPAGHARMAYCRSYQVKA